VWVLGGGRPDYSPPLFPAQMATTPNDIDIRLLHAHNTAFKQQRLKAWTPVWTTNIVITTLISIGAICLLLGAICIGLSVSVVEVEQQYDLDCAGKAVCNVAITIPSDMSTPVFVYYKLANFFQNHRAYVKSRDEKQLRAQDTGSGLTCAPLTAYGDAFNGPNSTLDSLTLYPCGLIANTYFNDTFLACVTPTGGGPCVPLQNDNWRKQGIAWTSDLQTRFVPRAPRSSETSESPRGFTLPVVNDEDFVVWMRTSVISTFHKLYRVIGTRMLSQNEILNVTVANNYDVSYFGGSKYIVLSTHTGLGGRNHFLGIAFFVLCILCFCACAYFWHFSKSLPPAISPRSRPSRS